MRSHKPRAAIAVQLVAFRVEVKHNRAVLVVLVFSIVFFIVLRVVIRLCGC
jgi:hypothetical protein